MTHEDSAHRFALLQLDRDADPMDLARALAEARSTPVQDQVLEARSAWGIVAEGLPEAAARSLGHALTSAGVRVGLARMGSLPRLPEPEPVRTAGALPADAPVLVAVAAVTVTTTTAPREGAGPTGSQRAASAAIMMTTGLPIKIGGRKRPVEGTRDEQKLSFHADLYYEDPARRLRIDPGHFDFSCLGDRMLYQGQANLRLLLDDVARDAPGAWLNRGARILLDGGPIRTMGYRSLDDLDRECRWLLTLRATGE